MKETALEKLARSYEIQTLYSHNLPLFKNKTDFSHIQLIFLNLVERYHQLAIDIASGEENTEKGMEKDPLRVEAYFLWREKHFKEMRNNAKTPEQPINDGKTAYKINFE